MTDKVKKYFSPVIVRWPAVILSPENLTELPNQITMHYYSVHLFFHEMTSNFKQQTLNSKLV